MSLTTLAQTMIGGLPTGAPHALLALPYVLDDPFLGLAPPLRGRLASQLRELAAGQGLAILAVGQHVRTLLRVAHGGYVLDAGRILVAGTGPELLDNPGVRRTRLDLGRETSP